MVPTQVPDAWNCVAFLLGGLAVGAAARPALAMLNVKADEKADDEKMTIEKVSDGLCAAPLTSC